MADVISMDDKRRFNVARAAVSDLHTLIPKLEQDYVWYSQFKKYIPLNGLVAELNIAKSVLKLHLERCTKVMDDTRSKGQ